MIIYAFSASGPGFPMPIPPLLRLAVNALIATVLTVALYLFVRGAVMLYEAYQFIQWIGEFGE